MPERGALLYRQTNSEATGRYRIIKEVLADPHSSVMLVHTRLEIADESLRGKMRLFALLSPHLGGRGAEYAIPRSKGSFQVAVGHTAGLM
jgi:glucoamylase